MADAREDLCGETKGFLTALQNKIADTKYTMCISTFQTQMSRTAGLDCAKQHM
jgi:hypothetical protein